MLYIIVLALFIDVSWCQSRYNGRIFGPATPYVYSSVGEEGVQEIPQQEQIQYIKISRSDKFGPPSYEYNQGYRQNIDYQPQTQPTTENYPYQVQNKDFEEILKQRQSRLKVQKPTVEQYHKEVTPTTKTVYNQQELNYIQTNEQQEQTQETPNLVVEQPQYYYPHQAKQQRQYIQHYQIENDEAQDSVPKRQEIPQRPIIPQQPSGEVNQGTEGINSEKLENYYVPQSSIYVTQNIPKKSIRTKIIKQKEQERPFPNILDYMKQLQLFQQLQSQQRLLTQRQPQVFQTIPEQYKNDREEIRYNEPITQTKQKTVLIRPHVQSPRTNKYEQNVDPTEYQTSIDNTQFQRAEQEQYEDEKQSQPEVVPQYQRQGLQPIYKYMSIPKTVRYQATPLSDKFLQSAQTQSYNIEEAPSSKYQKHAEQEQLYLRPTQPIHGRKQQTEPIHVRQPQTTILVRPKPQSNQPVRHYHEDADQRYVPFAGEEEGVLTYRSDISRNFRKPSVFIA